MTFGKAIFLWTVIFLALFGSAAAVQAEDSAPVPVSVQGDKKRFCSGFIISSMEIPLFWKGEDAGIYQTKTGMFMHHGAQILRSV